MEVLACPSDCLPKKTNKKNADFHSLDFLHTVVFFYICMFEVAFFLDSEVG